LSAVELPVGCWIDQLRAGSLLVFGNDGAASVGDLSVVIALVNSGPGSKQIVITIGFDFGRAVYRNRPCSDLENDIACVNGE
jgi:hypothetical protein